jgi:hypothetical protein
VKHQMLSFLLTLVVMFSTAAPSSDTRPADSQAYAPSGVALAQSTDPEATEYFQLSFPIATKRPRSDVVIYTSMVDHTPGFYCSGSNNYVLQPYTGETVSTVVDW